MIKVSYIFFNFFLLIILYNKFLDDDGVILICGPRNMISDHMIPMLKSLQYKEENIIVF